jgi:hypothetical protein
MVKARNLGHQLVTLRTDEPFFREHAPDIESPDPWLISAQCVANYSGAVPQSVVTIPGGGTALVGRPVYGIRPRYPEDKSQFPALFAEAGDYQFRFTWYPRMRVATGSSFAVVPSGPGWQTGPIRLEITGQGREAAFRGFESSGVYLGDVPEERKKDVLAIAAQEVQVIEAFNGNDATKLMALLADEATFETADFSQSKPNKDGLTTGRTVTSTGATAAQRFLITVGTLSRMEGFQRSRPTRLRMERCRDDDGNLRLEIRQEIVGNLSTALTRDYVRDIEQVARALHQPLPKADKQAKAAPPNGRYTAVYSYSQTWKLMPAGWRIVKISY